MKARRLMYALCSFSALIVGVHPSFAGETPAMTYRITVTNLTAGNGVSPFLLVAHDAMAPVFTPGQPASPGVAAIAESGDASVAKTDLASLPTTLALVQAEGGPIGPAQSRSAVITIPASAGAHPRLTLLAMIGRSNDSFVALRSIDLTRIVWGKSGKTWQFAQNFDAGSEENSGNVEDFGPGGHPTAQAEGFITYDRGLNSRGNAPDIMAWGPKVASVLIEKMNEPGR